MYYYQNTLHIKPDEGIKMVVEIGWYFSDALFAREKNIYPEEM